MQIFRFSNQNNVCTWHFNRLWCVQEIAPLQIDAIDGSSDLARALPVFVKKLTYLEEPTTYLCIPIVNIGHGSVRAEVRGGGAERQAGPQTFEVRRCGSKIGLLPLYNTMYYIQDIPFHRPNGRGCALFYESSSEQI